MEKKRYSLCAGTRAGGICIERSDWLVASKAVARPADGSLAGAWWNWWSLLPFLSFLFYLVNALHNA